jgi:hypothetical protein
MYKIYWTNFDNQSQGIYTSTLNSALRITEEKRQAGYTFVTMVSEDPNSVGRPGVDSIEDGQLPDGTEYTWRKRR